MPSITEYLSEPRIDSWPISTSSWLSESFSGKGSPRQKQGLFCKAVWCGFFPAFLSFSQDWLQWVVAPTYAGHPDLTFL